MIVYFFMFNFIKFFSFANLKLVSCFSVQKKKKKNQKSCLMPFTFPHCKSCINSCNLRCFHFRQKNWNKKKQSYSFVTVQSANQNHLLPGTSVLWNFNTHFIFFFIFKSVHSRQGDNITKMQWVLLEVKANDKNLEGIGNPILNWKWRINDYFCSRYWGRVWTRW